MKIVHVGFPKTATTYLQWEIFPRLKGINYVDYNACRKIFPFMIYRDIIDYDPSEMASLIDEFSDSQQSNLYSFEALCGQQYGGAKGMNRSLIAQGLKTLGFDKVVFTIRHPVKAVDSYYRQYIIHGGTLSFTDFIDLDNKREWSVKHFNLEYLKYANLIRLYVELFGEENVLIICQENLKGKFEEEINRLSVFTNTEFDFKSFNESSRGDANASLTNLSTSLLRFFNFFSFNTIRPSSLLGKHFSTRNFWLLLKLVLDPYLFRFISSTKSYVQSYGYKKPLTEFYKEANKDLERYNIFY